MVFGTARCERTPEMLGGCHRRNRGLVVREFEHNKGGVIVYSCPVKQTTVVQSTNLGAKIFSRPERICRVLVLMLTVLVAATSSSAQSPKGAEDVLSVARPRMDIQVVKAESLSFEPQGQVVRVHLAFVNQEESPKILSTDPQHRTPGHVFVSPIRLLQADGTTILPLADESGACRCSRLHGVELAPRQSVRLWADFRIPEDSDLTMELDLFGFGLHSLDMP